MTAIDRRRFARQLLLAEIGEAGQARLCAARVRVAAGADGRAAEVAREYLERAGVQVTTSDGSNAAAEHVLALPSEDAVRALAGRPELSEAAAALAGAYAAVEVIKAALGRPAQSHLPEGLQLATGAGA